MLICSFDISLILNCLPIMQIFQKCNPNLSEIKTQDFHGHLARFCGKGLCDVSKDDRVKS